MKKIIFFLLVAIAAISLSAVSAAENTSDDTVLTSYDDSAIVSESNDISYSENATVESNTIQDTTVDNIKTFSDDEIDQSGVITAGSVSTNGDEANNTITVTNTTFFNYFDDSGILKDNVTSSDLTFEGNFTGLGINTIIINKQINLIGNNAILNNIGLSINADNVSVSDFTISLINNSNVESAIEIMGTNVNIINNLISVESAVNETSFAIYAENAANLTINNNNIAYIGKTNGSAINNAIRVIDSNNASIVNNNISISIPSVPVYYDPITWEATVMSEGIHVSGFTNLTIDSNNILVEYNNASGAYDTIYALDIIGNNANIKNNNITTNGHTYTYGINIVGEDIAVDSNIINSISDNNYANAIQIQKGSNGAVNNNDILVDSPVVAYGIYSSDYSSRTNNITYNNNVVTGGSSYVYGIYVSGHDETLVNNNIYLTGNFTTGVASSADNLTMGGNNIIANGNNMGNASNCGDYIIAETTGIKIVRGNANVMDCSVQTTGDYAINTTGAGSITYNYLVSNVGLGDATVIANNQTIVENNGPRFFLDVFDLVKIYGSADRLQAILTDAKYNPIVNATVTFNVNGVNYNRTTNASGIASMSINLLPGLYNVTTIYNTTTIYSNITVISSIVGEDADIFQNETFNVTFFNIDGDGLANTNVSFNIGGIFYTAQTNENGTANLNINLPSGKYVVTAINPVNNEQKGFNINVTGNSVTNDTFFIYFDENGVLRNNIIFNDLIFVGNFTGLNVSAITINKKMKLIGEDAVLNNIPLVINADNVFVSNFTIILTNSTGSAVSINGANVTISNNTIAVNGRVNETSFAINAENADNLIINGNSIDFEGKTNGSAINNAIRVTDSNNVGIVNNNISISIPSVPVYYDPITWEATVMSEGIHVSGFTNLTIDSNNILVEYNNASGAYDTIYALDIIGNNANIKNNNITTNGHTYTYGINIVGEDIAVDSNIINSISDNNYANAIQIQKGSNGVVNNNEILVISPVVAYGIYSSDYSSRTNNITYNNNVVAGNSSYVYGIYVSGHDETLVNNNISLTGNFTTGVASSADILNMNGTIIVTAGNGIGNASNCGDSIIAETTGIKIVRGNANITNSSVQTNGDCAINTTGAGSITYNYLVSNVGLGDNAVIANNQTIVENNTPKLVFEVSDLVKIYGSADKLQAILIGGDFKPIVNATVTFNVNGVNYNRTTNASGIASMSINLLPGLYNVTTTYNNDTVKSIINITSSIEGNNIVKFFQNGTQFIATFYGIDGKVLANTTVKFNINGVFYNRTTDENGTARLNINLNPNEYILTAINPVNGEQKGFNVTVLSTIETQNLVKYYRNGTQFVVKVLNKDGTPANGTNITFNINGVFYTRNVVNGTAQLSINLNPGEYQITTIYEGLSVGNTISVKPTLVTNDLSMSFQDGSKFNATVLDAQGNPLANQIVLFNVNGVFYNRTSDANGVASLNINLNKGNYIITSMWNEYQVGNKITIA